MTSRISSRLGAATVCAALALASAAPSGAGRKFYNDDPIAREPATQDASKAAPWDIDLFIDLSLNLFGRPGDSTPDVRAQSINTIDEVPDSSWFTNRIGTRAVTIDEAVRGPLVGDGPAPGRWEVSRAKEAGAAPGFTMRDSRNETWFVSLDSRGNPEAATGALLVANKIFWTLGYWQVENFLISIRPDQLDIASTAVATPPSGKRRPMRRSDVDAVFERSQRSPDGSYRAIAARGVPGKVLGGFRYHGTRPDDPNDIIPHEHRRELRALKVFGGWTNLVDMKAGNTLDSLITENGRATVRHYLQDVGSAFGSGANGPHDYFEGWEYLHEGGLVWKRMFSLGFYISPWQTADYNENPAIGRFEGTRFDPRSWKPRVPAAAFLRARPDDDFWAARRVMAFSDDMVRAIAKSGAYSDPAAEKLLADVLIQRRDRIGAAFLPAVNPVVDVKLDGSGVLTFANAAVDAKVATAPAGGYAISWSRFDNDTNTATPIGTSTATAAGRGQAPSALPAASGAYVKVEISADVPANPSWKTPAAAYFQRTADGWKLVGFERMQ
jgi:hypothetical protein